MAEERLQKILARAGVASRRKCEEIIAAGRVTVNGKVVATMGAKADPERQEITFDGERIGFSPRRYFAVYKPLGVVSTTRDPHGRPKVTDLVHGIRDRLFAVGRLDADSEGLMILTNDGAFAERVTHPRYQVPRTYLVEVDGELDARVAHKLRDGVRIDTERPARARRVRVLKCNARRSLVELSITEGRKRVVRRMFAALGHPVCSLKRTAIGNVRLGRMNPGDVRRLDPAEVGEPAGGPRASRGASAKERASARRLNSRGKRRVVR